MCICTFQMIRASEYQGEIFNDAQAQEMEILSSLQRGRFL